MARCRLPALGDQDPGLLRRRRAQLRLRFHDLRHTFGSLAITRADIIEVQAWMGHADIQTTMRYLHYRDRGQAAERLADAFRVEPTEPARTTGSMTDASPSGIRTTTES